MEKIQPRGYITGGESKGMTSSFFGYHDVINLPMLEVASAHFVIALRKIPRAGRSRRA
jgi:hypothetical protein